MMKWRIAKKKMLFLRKLMLKDDSTICKRAIIIESLLGVKGLGHKCKKLSTLVGLPDIRYNKVNKRDIIKAIKKQAELQSRMKWKPAGRSETELMESPNTTPTCHI